MRKNSFLSIFPPELLLCWVDPLLNTCASYTALRMLLRSLLVQFQIIITLMRNHHQQADPQLHSSLKSWFFVPFLQPLYVVRRKLNYIFSLFCQTSLFVCNHRLFQSQNLRELRRWNSFVCCKWRKIMKKDSQKRRKREMGEKSRITESDRLSWDKKSEKNFVFCRQIIHTRIGLNRTLDLYRSIHQKMVSVSQVWIVCWRLNVLQ